MYTIMQASSESYQDDYDFCRQYSDENSVVHSDLYPNANLSVLKALSHIFQWFTSHPGTSKEAVSEMLSMQHKFLLPKENLLPESYHDAHQLIKPFLIKPEAFHACTND